MWWDDRIGRRLRLKDLHTLQTVAELGSMARASTQLALSQAAISKAMADLEHTLGVPLLERSARGVELTDYGRLLIERGRAIFDELREGLNEIEQRSDPTRGEIRIGTTEPITGVLSDIICSLVRKYPRITYHVNVSDTDTLARDLRERALLTMLPTTMLRQRSCRAWLRALDVDLSDSAGPIALITVKRRRSGGPLRYFEDASRAVCRQMVSSS